MGHIKMLRKILVSCIVLLFVGTGVLPGMSGCTKETIDKNIVLDGEVDYCSLIDDCVVDVSYIYNITKVLSNIVFTEYDEEHGEIAKGREFGTKGEHKAAEILAENMTKLGLYAWKEQIKNIPRCPRVANKIEILDYKLIITNKTSGLSEIVDCSPCASFNGPRGEPSKLDYNFSYKGLKVRQKHPLPKDDKEDYVLISGLNYPSPADPNQVTCNGYKFYIRLLKTEIKSKKDYFLHPHFKGYLCYDFNNKSHNQGGNKCAPQFLINGSVGRRINSSIEDYTVDFYLNQQFNKSVTSYDVIGLLNGTDPSKTVIIGCLYDGLWYQGTADSAIGMGIVMGIAKYFTDYNIKPKYNVKFIAFCGEEYGMRGSIYYEAAHHNENIIYVIDLNQLGFKQDGLRLKFEIVTNKRKFTEEIWNIAERTDYVNRTGNVADIKSFTQPMGHISDDRWFAVKRPFRCKTVCFLKGGPWILHHRDGLNHTVGDVIDYFDWNDVSVTSEMIWNVTKYLTVDP
jgi:hypothetical protein